MSKFKIGDKVTPKDKVNGRWRVLDGDPKYYIVGKVVTHKHSPVSYHFMMDTNKVGHGKVK